MNTPMVSVVLPFFNAETYLAAALDSMLAQTLQDFEVLLIDDQSTDNSRKIAEEYRARDGRIKILPNTEAKGVAGALNTGLAAAQGTYIARMDADDISVPERFAQQVAYMEAHPDVSMCGSWLRLIGENAGAVWKLATDWDTIRCTMLFYGAIPHPTLMFRRSDFVRHGWRYSPDYAAEDYDLLTRVAEHAKMVNLPQVLYLYRWHADNVTKTYSARMKAECRQIRLRQLLRLGLTPTEADLDIHEYICECWSTPGATANMVQRATAWLDLLLTANHASHFLPETALKRFVLQKRLDVRASISWRVARQLGHMVVLGKFKDVVKARTPKPLADYLGRVAVKLVQRSQGAHRLLLKTAEAMRTMSGRGFPLQKTVPEKFKIGMAVMAHERPEYLELCLDTLFRTNLHDYDITFLISDDGSQDPRVREIINRPRDPRYKIIRSFTPKGPNNWGAAFNKAMRQLLALDSFDIVGTCDTDVIFHPEWLDKTLQVALWAKQHHKFHVLGPFSSFNSSDFVYHQVLGTYHSPAGDYLVKRQMSAQNYFYFRKDFEQLGYFEECPDDETLMTGRFIRLGVRNFCTAISYVEHIGQDSILNQWRPTPVRRLPHGRHLAPTDWGSDMEKISPYAYYRYLKPQGHTCGAGIAPSTWPVDVLMPVIRKDMATLPLAVAALRKQLRHPLGKIILVSPPDESIQAFCREHDCAWRDENSVLPIKKADIHYEVNGTDRSGWIFKQLLQLYADQISTADHILLFDADTVMLQPQKFEYQGRSLMVISDEYHWPYYLIIQKLFGFFPADRFSLTSHHLFVNRQRLAALRAELEQRHQRPWHQAIVDHLDTQEGSAFSEYETYGQWMLQHHRDEVELEYWFNTALPRSRLWRHTHDLRHLAQTYRTVSYHHYHV